MKRFILTLGVIAILLPAGVILAQSDTRTDMQGTSNDDQMTVTGTIVSIDPSTVVVRTDDGRTMTFTRDKDSNMDKDLVTGQEVKVKYSNMTGGLFHLDDLSKSDNNTSNNYNNNTGATANPPASTGSVQGQYNTSTGTSSGSASGTYNSGTSTTNTYNNETTTGTNASGTSRTMPSTASPIPLVGLAGLLALGAGIGLRAYLRQ